MSCSIYMYTAMNVVADVASRFNECLGLRGTATLLCAPQSEEICPSPRVIVQKEFNPASKERA